LEISGIFKLHHKYCKESCRVSFPSAAGHASNMIVSRIRAILDRKVF